MKTKIDMTQITIIRNGKFDDDKSGGGVKPRQRMHKKIYENPLLCKLSKSIILKRV